MDDQNLFLLWISATICTWSFLLLYYYFFLNSKRLLKKGYSQEYVAFIRADNKKRAVGISLAIPIILLVSYAITIMILGKNETYNNIVVTFLIFILLILPFPLIDYFKTKKAYRKLAIESKSEIVIDLNHQYLHKFFNPLLEAILSFLFISLSILIFDIPAIVYIHIVIPWILYISAKNAKFVTMPLLRDGYLYTFLFMIINYAIVIFYMLRYTIMCSECTLDHSPVLSLSVAFILALRAIYYIYSFQQSYKSMV